MSNTNRLRMLKKGHMNCVKCGRFTNNRRDRDELLDSHSKNSHMPFPTKRWGYCTTCDKKRREGKKPYDWRQHVR